MDINQQETKNYAKIDSIPEQLKQYKELFDSSIIAEEEFNAKKKELLKL